MTEIAYTDSWGRRRPVEIDAVFGILADHCLTLPDGMSVAADGVVRCHWDGDGPRAFTMAVAADGRGWWHEYPSESPEAGDQRCGIRP